MRAYFTADFVMSSAEYGRAASRKALLKDKCFSSAETRFVKHILSGVLSLYFIILLVQSNAVFVICGLLEKVIYKQSNFKCVSYRRAE